ncbi:unnamed protein product [Leuciscus chuanchicus]
MRMIQSPPTSKWILPKVLPEFHNSLDRSANPPMLFSPRNPGSAEAKLTVPENGLQRKWF